MDSRYVRLSRAISTLHLFNSDDPKQLSHYCVFSSHFSPRATRSVTLYLRWVCLMIRNISTSNLPPRQPPPSRGNWCSPSFAHEFIHATFDQPKGAADVESPEETSAWRTLRWSWENCWATLERLKRVIRRVFLNECFPLQPYVLFNSSAGLCHVLNILWLAKLIRLVKPSDWYRVPLAWSNSSLTLGAETGAREFQQPITEENTAALVTWGPEDTKNFCPSERHKDTFQPKKSVVHIVLPTTWQH